MSSLFSFFASGGVPMLPVVLLALLVIGLSIRAWHALRDVAPQDRGTAEGRIDAVLFWGLFAAVVGVLGTLGGLTQMARMVELAGGGPAALVWGGVRAALTTAIAGVITCAAASIAWFVLRRRLLRLQPD